MRPEERETLRQRFQFRCGYCGVSERDAGASLTVDHFQPHSRGGLHEPENWVYCCHACNEFKGDTWQPNSPQRVLYHFRDNVTAHFVERADGKLDALSETGAFHIETLHLNRAQLVAYRMERRLLGAARQNQRELIVRLRHLEQEVQALTAQLEQLHRDDLKA